jgi:hypothetical protein
MDPEHRITKQHAQLRRVEMKALTIAAGMLLGVIAQPALAEDRMIEGFEAAGACAADIARICAGVLPGEGRIKECVLEKKAELSVGCREALGKVLSTALPNDSAKVDLQHFVNLRAVQYTEIFLVGGNPITGDLRANVYNTQGLNGYTETNKNSSPTSVVAAIDQDAVKKQYDVLGVHINGPKLWMLDWIDVPVGTEREFDALHARWVGELSLKGIDLSKPGADAYHVTTIERKTKFGYLKGQTEFLIDDPEGNTWIMKGMDLGVHPVQSYADAANLGSRLKLPPGYKFRTAVLPEDLVLIPETGIAKIMPDDLNNVYDITGPGYSNYKP